MIDCTLVNANAKTTLLVYETLLVKLLEKGKMQANF